MHIFLSRDLSSFIKCLSRHMYGWRNEVVEQYYLKDKWDRRKQLHWILLSGSWKWLKHNRKKLSFFHFVKYGEIWKGHSLCILKGYNADYVQAKSLALYLYLYKILNHFCPESLRGRRHVNVDKFNFDALLFETVIYRGMESFRSLTLLTPYSKKALQNRS